MKSNLLAKKGMRLFHEEGRLNDFSSRESAWKKIDQKNEIKEWKRYMEKSEAHRETLNENEPDIVEKINAHIVAAGTVARTLSSSLITSTGSFSPSSSNRAATPSSGSCR